jgi:subtilisin family serine protease
VAVIDTGVDATQPDLVGAVSAGLHRHHRSRRPGRDQPPRHPGGRHHRRALQRGRHDRRRLRLDHPVDPGRRQRQRHHRCPDCVFDSNDLAAALDYAVAKGAKVVNLSLGGDGPEGPRFEAALARAAAAGTVVAIASGNEGDADPSWPARYAVDPRYAGSVIAVGALTQAGVMASYSNKAGVAANGYMAAPGDSILTECDSRGLRGGVGHLVRRAPGLGRPGPAAAGLSQPLGTGRGRHPAAHRRTTWGRPEPIPPTAAAAWTWPGPSRRWGPAACPCPTAGPAP